MAKTPDSLPVKPRRAYGRDLDEIIARRRRPLSDAEEKLRDACRKGQVALVGEIRPEAKTDDNVIDAEVLRFFILGGDETYPVHEAGVRVRGAWIDGALDIQNAVVEGNIDCKKCVFVGRMILEDARIAGLYLDGSSVAGLDADRMVARAGVHLRDDFEAKSEVRLPGAEIGGSLACEGGKFLLKKGNALHCDGVQVEGGVFFRSGFEAKGTVRLVGAQIGGNLECDGGKFLSTSGKSLDLDSAEIAGSLFLRDAAEISGVLDCSGARVGTLIDDAASWPKKGQLILDGLRYGSIGGKAPTTAEKREDWLMLQDKNHLTSDFRPQPWKQAIKVLREMGHEDEARALAVRFEQQRRAAGVVKGPRAFLHDIYGALAGYGYRPMRLLLWAVGVWVICALTYRDASNAGIMAPTNPLVFEHPANEHCRPRAGENTTHWTNTNTCNGPNEYTTFQPLLYSLDLILPLVDLQQDKDWSPMVTRATTENPRGPSEDWPLGHFIRIVMWFEILFGWVASLLFVAILSGLIKKAGDE